MLIAVMIVFVVLLLSGMPVFTAMGIAALAYALVNDLPASLLAYSVFQALHSFPLVAGPLYILMGSLANEFGETERIFNFARLLMRRKRGYTAKVNVINSLIFSGISGSAVADIGGFGQIEIKAMKDEGFSEAYAGALVCATSIIGPMFPPSIPLIIYAVTAQVSTLRALLAGAVPALIITFVIYVFVTIQTRTKLPPLKSDDGSGAVQGKKEERFSRAFLDAFPMLFLVPLMIVLMLVGVFSPSEAGAFAVIYILFVQVLRRTFSFQKLRRSLVESYKSIACIFMIIAVAGFFTKVLTLEHFPEMVTRWFLDISQDPIMILVLVNVMLLIIGMFMEMVSTLIILTPILLTVTGAVGVDPFHLGVILVFNLEIGMFTPPLGVGVYAVAKIANTSPDHVFREMLGLYWPLLVSLIIITFFPKASLWLPSLVG
jgi:tripartite ATP-independent transporter DctM subunit